jgi:choloylglycine hydrolase
MIAIAAGMGVARACTGITVRAKDGSIVFARTLEFAQDLQSNIVILPRGQQLVGTSPTGKPGLHWTSKYGVVGVNAFGLPITLDGTNEPGLSVGLFYFPGYADYQAVTAANFERSLAPWELGTYLLGTCASVEEAVQAANNIVVGKAVLAQMGMVPPAHFIVSDATGHCAVLEYLDGELHVRQNPLGVFTNSPSFDWHVTNLGNYVNLGVNNVPRLDLNGVAVHGLGQGSGMLGLPGDFTPPSRFVRAVAFSKAALPVHNAREAVLQAFHLLNQFDIPPGAARGVEQGQTVSDYTQWTAAADLANRRYYFRTFHNSQIRMIDLKKVNFAVPRVQTVSMHGEEVIQDVTDLAK